MRRLALTFTAFVAGALCVHGQVDMDSSVADPVRRAYYDVICATFQVTRKEILILARQLIRDEQIPVVLTISREARAPAQPITDHRLRGQDFLAIAARYKLDAEIFRYPCSNIVGKPFTDAFDHMAAPDRNARLTDNDVVNLVNLRMLAGHHKAAPETIMRARTAGESFPDINRSLLAAVKTP